MSLPFSLRESRDRGKIGEVARTESMSTALITGASFGIGEALAKALAERGINLVLVARSRDKLEQLAQQLRDRVRVEVIVRDLTEPNAVENVFERVQQKGIEIDLLINNAGFGDYGKFAQNSRTKQLGILHLNVLALVDLTYHFLPLMQQRGRGHILNISSITAFQPMPYLAVYAATKAFILHFSEALWAENQDTGVNILAVCPGPTKTKFFEVAGFDPFENSKDAEKESVTPEYVAKEALKAMDKGHCSVVIGEMGNHAIANISRFLPREAVVKIIEKQFRPKK
nr:SDR family oxidoreductase [Lusitaniella coriacea]